MGRRDYVKINLRQTNGPPVLWVGRTWSKQPSLFSGQKRVFGSVRWGLTKHVAHVQGSGRAGAGGHPPRRTARSTQPRRSPQSFPVTPAHKHGDSASRPTVVPGAGGTSLRSDPTAPPAPAGDQPPNFCLVLAALFSHPKEHVQVLFSHLPPSHQEEQNLGPSRGFAHVTEQ